MAKEFIEMLEACKNAQDSLDKITSIALSQGDFLMGSKEDVWKRLRKIIVEGTVKPELSRMSDEEFIQWVCANSGAREEAIRECLPEIEADCARKSINAREYIEKLLLLSYSSARTIGRGVHENNRR